MRSFVRAIVLAAFLLGLLGEVSAQPIPSNEEGEEVICTKLVETQPLLLLRQNALKYITDPKQYSDAVLLHFIFKNFHFPPEAMSSSGTIVLTFVIGTDGYIEPETIRCLRSFHPKLAKEGIRIMQLFADLRMRWQAGTIAGQPVRMLYHLPIRICIQ